MGSAAHHLEGAKHVNRENAFELHLVWAILVSMMETPTSETTQQPPSPTTEAISNFLRVVDQQSQHPIKEPFQEYLAIL